MSKQVEADFLPDYAGALRGDVNRFAYLLTVTVVAFVAVFLVWAHYAVIDEVTRGEARVIPSRKIQVVQNLEGGILSEMLVTDGQIVHQGDVLLRLTNTGAQADYHDSRAQAFNLKAMIARLDAESSDKSLNLPPEVVAGAPLVAESERQLYESQMSEFKSAVGELTDQLTQRQQEIAGLRAREQSLTRSLSLAEQERAMTAPLIATGAAGKIDLVKLDREVSDLQGQLNETRAGLPRATAARDEAARRIQEKTALFHSDARAEMNKHAAELEAVTQKVVTQQDKVTRTEVRSPVYGTIKEINRNTIGATIRPGEDLVEIVPLEDTLLVEAKVRPSDIAFLRPGQSATVKITAYDYSIYGGLKAQLEQISADAIKEEGPRSTDTFFRVTLRTDRSYLGSEAHPLPIIPGMTATAEIKTGKKTVLDYLLKPIFKARDRALRER
jgi:adhesin transport system membrane fusion protein